MRVPVRRSLHATTEIELSHSLTWLCSFQWPTAAVPLSIALFRAERRAYTRCRPKTASTTHVGHSCSIFRFSYTYNDFDTHNFHGEQHFWDGMSSYSRGTTFYIMCAELRHDFHSHCVCFTTYGWGGGVIVCICFSSLTRCVSWGHIYTNFCNSRVHNSIAGGREDINGQQNPELQYRKVSFHISGAATAVCFSERFSCVPLKTHEECEEATCGKRFTIFTEYHCGLARVEARWDECVYWSWKKLPFSCGKRIRNILGEPFSHIKKWNGAWKPNGMWMLKLSAKSKKDLFRLQSIIFFHLLWHPLTCIYICCRYVL